MLGLAIKFDPFIKAIKLKISFRSSPAHCSSPEPDARLMIGIASDMESLFVYEYSGVAGPINCKLIWSTQLPFVPVALSRANFDGMPGGLVLLGEKGQVHVGFFGSDPQIFKVAPLDTADNDQHTESVSRELERLEADIKQGIDFTGK